MQSLSPFKLAGVVIARDLRLAARRWDQVLQPLVFFVVVITLFPLAISPELSELRRIAPGILWVAAMLASLLAADALFRPDVEDGVMEQWVLSGQPLPWLLLAKTVAHWVLTGLPLVLIAPLIAMALGVADASWLLMLTILLLGTAVLSVLGGIGAALTVGLRRGNMLMALLVLPLEMPVLIFGARALDMGLRGEMVTGPVSLLAAILLLGMALGPFAMAAAIRISIE
ncbi:MAG: heme exporter protein CcmB [Steroidobacteraceae bacterium]